MPIGLPPGAGGTGSTQQPRESADAGAPASPAGQGAKRAPLPLGRMLGSRDWLLTIECRGDGVVFSHGNQKFSLETLSQTTGGEHPLTKAVREVVARRQATVGPGEPPWRPRLRFLVQPDGLPAYYLAYPLLGTLRLPMARENVER